MSRVLPARRIWGAPAALGVLSLVGLVAALVADGWGDALSWAALAAPAAVCAGAFRRRGAPAPRAHAGGRPRHARPLRRS